MDHVPVIPAMQPLRLRKLQSADALPFGLLLLADETVAAIEKYIYDSAVYVLADATEVVGVAALYPLSADELEIKNIAVAASHQNRGVGSVLIQQILEIARKQQYKTLIVGTADTGLRQIRFYERNGFKKYALRKNFFIEQYPQPIFENGVQLKDMILLRQPL
ncbi:GNAT family N-acetyltransferase [Niabella sp. CC-SYL272]|uniref:GNAT family N-acetyltransferase n=1 Tax=Niabella agricola TaxID=2891571 RepID=UPI001F47FAC1|nr:GNAT family N-acetyltransferase [Niabella agricola]MCF3111980.1 GNAT family N-acetyltransferase [Niabella agricola]